MNPYRQRIWNLFREQLPRGATFDSVLDFGCGDGWFARQFLDSGVATDLVAIDVKRREHVLVEPRIYPGGALPFADGEFQLAYAVDVLHHCDDPEAQLLELARCSSEYLLLKDHSFQTGLGRWSLAVLDELGNRRFGIPSPYHYQRGWCWHELLVKNGWERVAFVHPAPVHVALLGWLTNSLQFVALYRRS